MHKDPLYVNNYFDKIKRIVDELRAIGRHIVDKDLIVSICIGLGPRYTHCTCSFNNKGDKFFFAIINNKLLSYENLLTQQDKIEENLVCHTKSCYRK